MTDAEHRIQEFISEEILTYDSSIVVSNDTRLLDGILNSLALTQLVDFLEDEFALEIDEEDITKEHFGTINQIATLVRRRASDS